MTTENTARQNDRIEIKGQLDPHAAEALRMEIGRLAKQHGIDIVESRWEKERAGK
jgi:hypothetical protein